MIARRGITLLELVISLSVVSILLGAMGSVILISARTMPGTQSDVDRVPLAQRAWTQIADDVRTATSVTMPDKLSLVLVVPERNPDGSDMTVTYAWGGNSGDALTREVDGGGAAPVITGVTDLEFGWAVPFALSAASADSVRARIAIGTTVVSGQQRCLNAERSG